MVLPGLLVDVCDKGTKALVLEVFMDKKYEHEKEEQQQTCLCGTPLSPYLGAVTCCQPDPKFSMPRKAWKLISCSIIHLDQ
jgi:hypothetical protein